MTRDATPYGADSRRVARGDYRTPINGPEGADTPVAGFYRGKLRSKGALCGIKIWFGQPLDPITGEAMDRSLRWQAQCNGEYVEVEDVWPYGVQMTITERQYEKLCQQQAWAREHAPNSALADPKRKSNPINSPLYF